MSKNLLAVPLAFFVNVSIADELPLRDYIFGSAARPDYSSIETIELPSAGPSLTLQPNDDRLRIVLLGNTLVHRESEFGIVETELTRMFPTRDFVFRNLGWPGDTIHGDARIEFGPGETELGNWQRPDRDPGEYGYDKLLAQVKQERPDVLFVAYGSNVAFEDDAGLVRFQTGLDRLLADLKPTGVRIVLVSTPPREIREGTSARFDEQNERLGKLAGLLRQVAADASIGFVDLYGQWDQHYQSETPYTDNGIHLNETGYQVAAAIIAGQITAAASDWLLHLDAKGQVKESTGTSVAAAANTAYGIRWKSHDTALPAIDPTHQRTLKIEGLDPGIYILDIDGQRVARADAQAWAVGVAIGQGPDVDRLNDLRHSIINKNRQYFFGFRPQNRAYIHFFRRYERGHHAAEIERFALLVRRGEEEISRLKKPLSRIYELVREDDYPDHEVPEQSQPDIEAEIAAFNLPDGFEISLFASDPMIGKPININWDQRGRMWVATSTIYPHLQPGQTPSDEIIILEDIDKDGVADKRTVFADGLLVPHSVIPGHGGALVTQSTDLLFLKDTDGDGRADQRQVWLTGFGNADVHHMIHGLRWGPGGDLYFNQSIYINSIVETPWGIRRSNGSCVWRLRPETLRLEMHSQGLTNPWGLAFDANGQSFATDGAGGGGIAYLFPGSAYNTQNYAGRQLSSLNQGQRPKECGLEYLSGRHLPDDWQDTFLSADFRANRVTRYRLQSDRSGYRSEFLGDMITSSHRGFRPVDMKVGPDGAIYIVDWYNLVIDHGEVDFHHPTRDKRHGRIWRLSAKDRELVPSPNLADASVRELIDLLRVPEQWTRDQARRLLREQGSTLVLPELQKWISRPDASEQDLREALWVHQGLRSPNVDLLSRCLAAHNPSVRAAAVRVIADWHPDLPDAIPRLRTAVTDENAQVRLEAINALREVGSPQAIETSTLALDQPVDSPIEFAMFRTLHERRDAWLPALKSGQISFYDDPQKISLALTAVGAKAPPGVLAELIRGDQLSGQQLIDSLAVVASSGDAAQRSLVLQKLSTQNNDAKIQVLDAILLAPRKPVASDTSLVTKWIDNDHARIRLASIELSGRWKLSDTFSSLSDRVGRIQTDSSERLTAGLALIAIDPVKAVERLDGLSVNQSKSIRSTAISALARGATHQAAARAASLLAKLTREDQIAMVVRAFVEQTHGARSLARALEGVKLSEQVVQNAITHIRLAGVEQPELVAALRQAGGMKPVGDSLTADEISAILKAVRDQGDPARGKSIFARKDLQCAACHRVGRKGGRVGPELSSVGGSAQLPDILQSLVDPSAKIKQGFQTTQIITSDGQIVTGIVQQETDSQVTLRDAKDQLKTIPVDEIVTMRPSRQSTMPSGLLETLHRDELIDLLKYLSSLGTAG